MAKKTRLVNLRSRLSSASVGLLQPAVDRQEIRGAPADRGYDERWRAASAAYRARHPACEYCRLEGRDGPAELVDHLYPHGLRRGQRSDQQVALFWLLANWVSCCHECHRSFKQRIEAQGIRAIDLVAVRLGRDKLTRPDLREASSSSLARAYGWGGDA